MVKGQITQTPLGSFKLTRPCAVRWLLLMTCTWGLLMQACRKHHEQHPGLYTSLKTPLESSVVRNAQLGGLLTRGNGASGAPRAVKCYQDDSRTPRLGWLLEGGT